MDYRRPAFFDDLGESDVRFPISNPALLVSDGNAFYEVPLPLLPPSEFGLSPVERNQAPTSPMETEFDVPPQIPATPMPSAAAGAASLPDPLPPLSTTITRVVGSKKPLSDEAARMEIETYIRASDWFRLHAMESRVAELGVPACASQLAQPEQSIWACFFKRIRRKGAPVFKCVACGHESDKLHRAVSHQRAKWVHKPYACTDPGCTFRGSSLESLSDHCSTRTSDAPCRFCGQKKMIKNMDRHLKKVHCIGKVPYM